MLKLCYMKNIKIPSLLDKEAMSLNWQYYLARPFSLFGSSIWNYWYSSKQIREILGNNMTDSLFIETQSKLVINYRIKKQLKKFEQSLVKLTKNKEKIESILIRGEKLNKEAAKKLKYKKLLSLEEEIEFLSEVAIYAGVIPYWIFNYLKDDDKKNLKLWRLGENLRSKSFYPKLIKDVINPLAKERLKKSKIKEVSKSIELITLSELLANNLELLASRREKRKKNFLFIYQNRNGNELVEWNKNQNEITAKIENRQNETQIIKGLIAYKGKKTGHARLILTNNYQNKKFNTGDILVSASTNPELTPLIKKAGAIVTDEGGIMCHAAIISRELKKPCIIGTKKATSIIKDGDLIAVDAYKGTIKIIEKIKTLEN